MSRAVATLADHAALVAALRARLAADALIETHISSVLLAGQTAYKLKKPVAFSFLDFSTPARRAHFCAEELRLNRRTAPQIYLDVQLVTGSIEAPALGGAGPVIEPVLRMRRFDPAQVLDRVVERDALTAPQIDALAARIAALHAVAAVAAADAAFGAPATVRRWVDANLAEVRADCHAAADRARLDVLDGWTGRTFEHQRVRIEARLRTGFVRECHGDLHLGNVVLIGGDPVIFDALEFNPQLRWIDVISDVAFLFMDLLDRDRPALAWRLLGGYLEATGDYDGVALLRYFAVYRALVRAKVALLRTQQPAAAPIARIRAQAGFAHYLALAESLAGVAASAQANAQADAAAQRPAPRDAAPRQARLIVMTGLSGSGKSTVALALATRLGALRVRADVERKRLAGLVASARGGADLYAPGMTERTYLRLRQIAADVLEAGVSVVIDAAALRADERRDLARVAAAHGAVAAVVACEAPAGVLEARVAARAEAGADPSDATLAVLVRQRGWRQPRAADEPAHLTIDTDCTAEQLEARCAALAQRLVAGDGSAPT